MFKYLLCFYCAAQVSYGCDDSVYSIRADLNADTDQFQFELSGIQTIELDRTKLKMVAPNLIHHIWHAEPVESLSTWCILESLHVTFGSHDIEKVQKRRRVIDSPSIIMRALNKADSLGISAVENDLIKQLAKGLVSSRAKKKFLSEPADFKKKYESGLSLLSPYQRRRLKEELVAPQSSLVEPIECASLQSAQRMINRFVFSPHNSLLVSMSEDLHALCLWDLRKKLLRYQFKDRLSIGTCIAFSADDSQFALSRGSDVFLFSPSALSDACIQTRLIDLRGPMITTLALDPFTNALLCNGQWYSDEAEEQEDNVHEEQIKSAIVSAAMRVKDQEQSVHQKSIKSLSHVFPEIYSSSPVFHVNGVDYAIGLCSGYVEIVACDIKEKVFIDDSPITAVGLSDTNNYVVGASQNGVIRVYQYGLLALMSVYRALMVRYIPAYVRDMNQPFPLISGGKDTSHYKWVSTLPEGLKDRLMPLLKIVQ